MADVCPTCGHRTNNTREPARQKRTWTVLVPDDAEDGAEVLNTMIDALAETLHMHGWSTRLLRYYVLVYVLAWVLQHEHELAADLQETNAG